MAFALSYFSGFRDELGQDYENYVYVIKEIGRTFNTVEPGYTLLVKIASTQYVSHLFFFVFFSFLTNFIIIYRYAHFRLFYLSVLVYFSYSILYYNSFNLVRQFLSAAIFLYASKYVVGKNFTKYFFGVIVASLFHFSAIFLVVLYWLRNRRLNFSYGGVGLIACLLIPYLFDSKYLVSSIISGFGYDHYLDSTDGYDIGFLHLYLNFLFFYMAFILDRSRIGPMEDYIIWMFFVCLVLYNLMPVFFYFYRLSIYFLVFFPLFVVLPVRRNWTLIHLSFSMFMAVSTFVYFLYTSIGNQKVIPSGLKSLFNIL